MRPVHVAGVAQLPNLPTVSGLDEAEMVQQVCAAACEQAGVPLKQIGFTVSGSCDYVMGRPFSFTMALDGVGAWPPIRESHVEMDGAWALYEAWVRLQHDDIDTALVYAFGKSSLGSVDDVLTLQLEPYYTAPLWPGPFAVAALQAKLMVHGGLITERQIAEVVARSRRASRDNPWVPAGELVEVAELLAAPYVAPPLRAHDASLRTDGAAAVVLRAGGGGPRIAGIAHHIDAHGLGVRDLTRAPSARSAGRAAGADRIDVAELYAPYAHQELLLAHELGLGGAQINPSGGALAAETPWVAGLVRIIEATNAVRGGARRALAHASSGPCLQHNLVAVLEAE
jgi:acetyl-CoA acetyltransferase